MATPSSGTICWSQIQAVTGGAYSMSNFNAVSGRGYKASNYYNYPSYFVYNFGDDGGTNSTCCGISAGSTAYANTGSPTTGTVFYSNTSLTTLFPMSGYSGLFIKYKLTSASTYSKARFNLSTSAINNTPASC
jgi:hypothetical protein